MAQGTERRGGLGLGGAVAVAVVAIFGIVIAFALLSFIAGLVWGIVKVAVVVALVAGVLWLLVGRR